MATTILYSGNNFYKEKKNIRLNRIDKNIKIKFTASMYYVIELLFASL